MAPSGVRHICVNRTEGFIEIFTENADKGFNIKVGGNVIEAGILHVVYVKGSGKAVHGGWMFKDDKGACKRIGFD
jgi:hypothetical protein